MPEQQTQQQKAESVAEQANQILFRKSSGLVYDGGRNGSLTIVCSDGHYLSIWKTVFPNLCHVYHANCAMRFLTSGKTVEETIDKAVKEMGKTYSEYQRPWRLDFLPAL